MTKVTLEMIGMWKDFQYDTKMPLALKSKMRLDSKRFAIKV